MGKTILDEPGKQPVYGVGIPDNLRSMVVTQVLARAGRSCQNCRVDETGERGSYRLHIHHVDGDPTNDRFKNLRLLCENCHRVADLVLSSIGTLQPDPTETVKDKKLSKVRRAELRSKKIENVTDKLIRFRIEKMKPKSVEMICKYLYLIDGRISEAVSKAYPSDVRTTPRGPVGTDVKMDLWFPPEYSTRDMAFKAQKDDGIKRVHPAAVFTVATAKRRGRIRTCAVPLDPEMEPWAMEMMQYFEEHGNDHVFPLTRQRVWEASKKVWEDLVYVIEDYSVVVDQDVGIKRIDSETTEEKRKSKRVDRHRRGWTLHALRHLRASDLVDYYGFVGANLSSFGGWTTATAMGVGSSIGRYLDLQWRSYFQKLLRKRY